ncbi:AMP-binding enzyme [Aspergillus parasiticus SU-1]|uniref:AMP-dependent synthetase/ligase domain-containing protein n=3 Tax=Aspergillus subgen. Circumdati TaxID=2720871 RepID=A0A5N6DQC4_ASPPA|nr:hypothetical protein BDV34DRAFT_192064 [Aspergillus parasiticus]KAE8315562.1 hypothetical protein BDV41DRAFT_177743 [Aspergillus transmontanensis]KJK67830.1 AMP-binding enzyme [Aspergillus parasiticus SU-1]
MAKYYPLSQILTVAKVHPFYSDTKWAPTRERLSDILADSNDHPEDIHFHSFPPTEKAKLYKHIARLTVDTSPQNGYRQSTYISTTGGGSGGAPMVFATDSLENRQQRAAVGSLIRACQIIEPGDWVLTMHVSGHFYRALDLSTELLESAGASVLCAGAEMEMEALVDALNQYRVNVVTGDAGQLVQLVRYLDTLPINQRASLQIRKMIYTSEPMTPAQRNFITSVLGGVTICSIIGSAEAGPWAVSNPLLTGYNPDSSFADFIFDTRAMLLEVLPLSYQGSEVKSNCHDECIVGVPDGEKGTLLQTSLQRLRNPLVRYVCGDVASLHPLPAEVRAKLPAEEAEHYRIVRIYGRDKRISFDWYGEYFEFETVQALMRQASWGILQWQVILWTKPDGLDKCLEVRLLRSTASDGALLSEEDLIKEVKHFFMVFEFNESLFQLKFLTGLDGFVRSATGRKVPNFVDRTT